MPSQTEPRITDLLPVSYYSSALRHDVRIGLQRTPKEISPRWLYDATGSDLYEQITRLPEYYLPAAETEILTERTEQIAALGAVELIELGSGSSAKTRLLLDALHEHGPLAHYVPLDISVPALQQATTALARTYPRLQIHALATDFTASVELPPRQGPRLAVMLGSTLGNLKPGPRSAFLSRLATLLGPQDHLLLGLDLVKPAHVLVPAYDDSSGVTAAFNRNVLQVLNRGLHADFDPDAFTHRALWNPQNSWIEMNLVADSAQTVTLDALDLTVFFAAGESLRTEVSTKFTLATVLRDLNAAGLHLRHWWTDRREQYAVAIVHPRHR